MTALRDLVIGAIYGVAAVAAYLAMSRILRHPI